MPVPVICSCSAKLKVAETTFRESYDKFNAIRKGLEMLGGATAIVNTLVWDDGYPADGLSEFARFLDEKFVPLTRRNAPRSIVPSWVQAASESTRSVWAGPALDRDVLKARAGLLRNYDPVVQSVETLRDAAATLQAAGRTAEVAESPQIGRNVDELAAAAADQENLVEAFKSQNALLQISLTFFRHTLRQLASDTGEPRRLVVPTIGALSNAMALVLRRRESVIGASNFVLLPLTFLSPVFMAKNLMPDWIRAVSRFNPVNWSVEAAREAFNVHPDWTLVLTRVGLLLMFTLASAWLATRAFRAYQRAATLHKLPYRLGLGIRQRPHVG